MIPEKILEDILCKYPSLIEDGLKLKGRQKTIYGRLMDILFEDKYKRSLIIELKSGPIKDEHLGQILSYEGLLLSADDPTIRVMLVGTRVPPNLQKSLDHHGIAWKEISLSSLCKFLKDQHDYDFLPFFEELDPFINKETPISDIKSGLQNMEAKLTQVEIEKLITKLKQSGNYKNFRTILNRKKENEERARTILKRNLGKLNYDHIKSFFDLVDEPYPFLYDGKLVKGCWFGLLIKPNALSIFREDIANINDWFKIITSKDIQLDRKFEILRSEKYHIKGLGIGFQTLVLYILDKTRYLIWFEKQHEGLRIVHPELTRYTGKTNQYFEYLDAAKNFASKYKFEPTELDFVFTRFPKLINK